MEAQSPIPRTFEDVFNDFLCRRTGLLDALFFEEDEFFRKCDPAKDNLCLYGHPNETWEVTIPVEDIPPGLPQPVLGINCGRDRMPRYYWLNMIAVHSDSWLISVAFYFGARIGFGRNERERLFELINRLPTISEVITGSMKQPEEGSATASNITPPPMEEDEEEDEEQSAVCGVCKESGGEEFWIRCDFCKIWFHGRCVKITPAEAKTIKDYKCPICTKNKKKVA